MDAKDVQLVNIVDVTARMPLAEAALTVWHFVFHEQRLQGWWEEYRDRCYQKEITFPTLTHLVADALLRYGGSGRRSFEKNQESGHLGASVAAAFGKLGRLPLPLSEAFLREGTAAVRELFPLSSGQAVPASLHGTTVVVIDGKAIKKVAKRLKPLRNVGGGLLGGKALVALEWQTGLAVAMEAHRDGDASEKGLVAGLLGQLDELLPGSRLFVADRGFCDLVQAARFTARPGDHFLVRYHGGTKFTPDPERPARTGTDSEGRTYTETWGWLGSTSNKGRRYVRRLELQRPGEENLILVTDLLDADVYPAADLLELYRQRWGIERLFQKVTEVFGLEGLIGSTPQACVFQFAFCMLLYNIVQVLTSYVAEAQQCEVEKLSKEKFFDDVQEQLAAWQVMFTPEQTVTYFATPLTAAQVRERLRTLLGSTWSKTWWKAPRQKNRRPSKREHKRGHSSVHRLLLAHASLGPKAKAAAKRC